MKCCPGDDFGQDDASQSSSSSSGGFLDSITSLFSDSGSSQPAPAPAPSFDPGDPNQLMSKYFTLANLTVTSLPYPNLPTDEASFNNLKLLGTLLDAIQDNVGAFTIASCFRSDANQAALAGGAQGSAAASMASGAKKSYHTQGLASDLTPKNGMSPTQFAKACYQNPLVKSLIGQIVDKSEGGETSLHISVQTPKFPSATPMYVGSDGLYYRMTPSQIGSWLSSQITSLDEGGSVSFDQDENYEGDVSATSPWVFVGAGALALIGAGFYFYHHKDRS